MSSVRCPACLACSGETNLVSWICGFTLGFVAGWDVANDPKKRELAGGVHPQTFALQAMRGTFCDEHAAEFDRSLPRVIEVAKATSETARAKLAEKAAARRP